MGTAARAWLAVMVLVGASACYRSHGRPPGADAGPMRDARIDPPDAHVDPPRDARIDARIEPPPDAALRGGSYWTLVPREANVSFQHELGCTQYDGGSIAIRVTAGIHDECEHGGPVEVEARADGVLVVRAFVWAEHREMPDTCLGITDQMARTILVDAVGGRTRVEDALGSSSAEITVRDADGGPCLRSSDQGAACLRDCDCLGELRCVPELGDFVECFGGRCGDPCNPLGSAIAPLYPRNLDCPETYACTSSAGASAVCTRTANLCEDDGQCGEGLACPMGFLRDCHWEVVLSGSTRHACAGDGDCAPGMHCVEHADGRRTCDVPCFTNDMRCPPMHACMPEAGWVCEWLGE